MGHSVLVVDYVRPFLNYHFGERATVLNEEIRFNPGPTRLSECVSPPKKGLRVVWHFKNSSKILRVGVICQDVPENSEDDCAYVRFFELPEGSIEPPRIL